MEADLSLLEDFSIRHQPWVDWQFHHQEYDNVPLAFFNRFSRPQMKCCDLSKVPARKQDEEFMVVEGNTKVTNRNYISTNIKMGERRKTNVASTRTFTKKQKRTLRTWHNQYKTKFKQLTVKNDWVNVKTFNKRDLTEHVPKVKKLQINQIASKGKLHQLNPVVERISWTPAGIKEKEEYHLKPVSTLQDSKLQEIATDLMNSQEPIRKSVVCSIEFLLAILTVRGGQYPWSISIQKEGNLLLFERYKSGDDDSELSYLQLFTTNENTTNNMPTDEGKIKEHCHTATKYTQMFKDLLASGEPLENNEQANEEQQKQKENENEENAEEEELGFLKKYVKIALDDIDIYTTVQVDGVKVKESQEQIPCLIRSFVETQTDGGWIRDIKKTQGTLVFEQYLSNSCSLQKWICEGRIAGVDMIKLGFVAFDKQKAKLINVNQATLKSLESYITFKEAECWPVLKYVLEVLYEAENGTYILSRSPYTPLALKLFRLPAKEQVQEQEDDE